MFVRHAFLACASLLFIGYLAAAVGVSAWGEFQTCIAFAAIVTTVAGIGVRAYLAREIAIQPDLGPRHLGSALMIRGLSGGLMLTAAIGLWLAFAPGVYAPLMILAAVSEFASLLYATIWLSFEAHERFQYILYVDVAARCLVIAVSLAVLTSGGGIVEVACVYALGNAVELALTVYFLRTQLYWPRFDARAGELWAIIRKSITIGMISMFAGAVPQLDRVLLRVLGDERAVGVYSAAWILSENFNSLSDLVLTAAFASGMRFYARDKEGFGRLYQTLLLTAALVGLPVGAGICLLGPDIIQLVYRKQEFAAAGGVLQLLAWQIPLTFAFRAGILPLVAARREQTVIKILVLALACDLLLSFLLVPRYGETGTALAALAATLCAVVATALKSTRWVRLADTRRMAKIGLATVLMSAGAFAVRSVFGMWAAAGAGAALYVALLFALRVATPAEIVGLLRRSPDAPEAGAQRQYADAAD